MAHYLIAKIRIIDREEYAQYEAGFMAVFNQFDGTMLSVDEDVRLLEGQWTATRTVLIEFPDEDTAMAWYTSSAYQSIARHRHAASEGDVILVKGLG